MPTCKATVILGKNDICKNCINADVCKHKANLDKDPIIGMSVEKCEYFKDKSKLIELPCKVGDTVYSFCDTFGVVLPYFVETLNISYYEKNLNYYTYEANCTNAEENELLDSIDFDIEDIGESVFLTKEEAEKALKERNNNDFK